MACVLCMAGCADTGHVPPPAAPPTPATSAAAASDARTTPGAPSVPASASSAVPAPLPAAAPAVTVPAVRPKPAAPAAAAATGQPAVKPKAPASSGVARPKPEVALAAAPAVGVTASAAVVAGPPASVQSVAPTLDLTALKQRLRDTSAIGVFTKLALKNQVDDLLDKFRGFYRGQVKVTLPELRQAYELLVQKVLALIQDSDPHLAKESLASREAIWGLLADPQKFATL
jgi:hypothetical protein